MKICLSCARCGVRYCRQSCQKDDWVAHKAVCRRPNKDEVIGEHTISLSEVFAGPSPKQASRSVRYASMLLLFNPESRPLTRLRIMTQRMDLRGTVIYHCFWRSDKKNGSLLSQTLTAHWQPLRFHEAHSSTIVFGGLYVQYGSCTEQSSTNGISFSGWKTRWTRLSHTPCCARRI